MLAARNVRFHVTGWCKLPFRIVTNCCGSGFVNNSVCEKPANRQDGFK